MEHQQREKQQEKQREKISVPMQEGFSIIYRHGRIMHNNAVRCFGLTGQQMGYLKYIDENPGTSQEELAKFMQIDKGAVAKAIKDMEAKDFIIRKQNPQDKRAYCLFSSEKAGEVARCGEARAAEFQKKLTEGMTAEEVEMFQLLLSKITANMAKMIKGEKE